MELYEQEREGEGMLKDLFDGTCRIAPLHMEWKTLELLNDPMEKAELIVEDSVTWERASDCLRVICTRKAGFFAGMQLFCYCFLCSRAHSSKSGYLERCFR